MIFISHRGNIKNEKENENDPNKILFCLDQGYDVEIDVWFIENKFYLGHDHPEYYVKNQFLLKDGLWCHAKNIEALKQMILVGVEKFFFHQNDDYVITSNKLIWTYTGKPLTSMSIAVMPENTDYDSESLKNCYGICSDNIEFYRNRYG